jgi:hypothetical protein
MKETPFPIDAIMEIRLSHRDIHERPRRDEIELRNPAEISFRFIQPLIRLV